MTPAISSVDCQIEFDRSYHIYYNHPNQLNDCGQEGWSMRTGKESQKHLLLFGMSAAVGAASVFGIGQALFRMQHLHDQDRERLVKSLTQNDPSAAVRKQKQEGITAPKMQKASVGSL